MANCERAKGVLNTLLNGASIRLDGDSELELQPSNQKRSALSEGEFTVERQSPFVRGTFKVPKGVSVKSLQEICGVPLTIELYDGRTFHMEQASNVSDGSYDAKKNTLELNMIGEFMEEVTPS